MEGRKDVGAVRVVVVGAGMAGLSTAEHLWTKGFRNITVLEAEDRIGGRVYSANYSSESEGKIELGATCIQGDTEANSVFTLGRLLGLIPDERICPERIEGSSFYRSDGGAIPRETTIKAWYALMELAYEAPPKESMEKWLKEGCEKWIRFRVSQEIGNFFPPSEHENVKAVLNNFLNWCRNLQGTSNLEELIFPALDVDGYDHLPGVLHIVPSGMGAIVEGLARDLPKDVVRLNSEVTNIQWEGQEVKVQVKGGEVHVADHVIITIPLGYLKHHHNELFSPALPKDKIEAIDAIKFGKAGKMFFEWEKPFWKPGFGGIFLAWTDKEREAESPQEWYKRLRCLDEVPYYDNLLVGWIGGDEAKYVEELSDDEVMDTVTTLIRKFMEDPNIPPPKRMTRFKWCTNPHFYGVYSCKTHTTTADHFRTLAKPLLKPGTNVPQLLFAGEATTNSGFGFVHGARDTGLREANRLIAHYGQGKEKPSVTPL